MKAWIYSSKENGLEANLTIGNMPDPNPSTLQTDQIIVKVLAAGLNPTDYKSPESAFGRFITGAGYGPAIPGMDFAGRVHATHNANDVFAVGDLVFGWLGLEYYRGSMADFTVVNTKGCVALPPGVDVEQAAGIGCAALSAYQATVPYVKEGSKVFVNGGSGGVGTYTIQMAKIAGAHVTATCSTGNVELVKELGADEVIDYKSSDVLKELLEGGPQFDHVVDNVGIDPDIYRLGDKYMKPGAHYIQVGISPTAKTFRNIAHNKLPTFLGGGKMPYKVLLVTPDPAALQIIASWMSDGKLRTVIDETYVFEDLPKAFTKLKTDRTRGKLIVKVSADTMNS